MVDLPRIPRRLVVSETPQSALSPADIAAPWKALAKGMDAVGEGLDAVAVPLAEAAGERAVTTDAEGNIQVQRAPIVGPAGVAFARAAKVAAMAQGETATQRELLRLREENRTDPQAFMEIATAYRNKTVDNYKTHAGDAVGGALGRSVDGQITRIHTGLVNEFQSRETKRAAEAIDSRLTTLADDMETLARKNGIGAEYQESLQNLDALLDEKVNNPLFAYPREKAQAWRDAVITRVQGAAVLEQVERVYGERGFDAARDYLRTSVKSLDGKVKQLDKVERAGLAWLRTEEAGYRAERTEIGREWTAAKPIIDTLPAATLQDMAQRAYAVGAHRVGRDIEANVTALDIAQGVRSLPRTDQARILQTGQVGGSGPLVDRIVGAESGGNPNAAATTSSALGAGQFTKGTWLDLVKRTRPDLAAGKTDEQVLALRTDGALSREMVGRYAEQNQAQLASAGVRTDDAALYLAHFLGPGDAIKVLAAGREAPLAGMVQQASIDANKGIFTRNPTAGQLADWAAGKVGGVDLTQSRAGMLALGQIKKSLQRDLPQRIADFKGAVGKQELPALEEVEALGAEVALLGTPDQKREVAELAAAAQYGREFTKLDAPQRAALVSQWEARMRDGATKFERHLGETLRAADRKIDEAYKTDPYGAFVRFAEGAEPTRAVDFVNPVTAADTLKGRVVQQGQIRAYERMGPFSALRPEEAKSVATTLTQADPQAAAATLHILNETLPADIYRATVADKPIREALDGMVRSYDPVRLNAGFSTLDKMWRSDPVGFNKDFGGDTLKRLQTWQAWRDNASPAEIAERFKRTDDPSFAAARKALGEEADTELKKWKADDIAGAIYTRDRPIVGRLPFFGQSAPSDPLQAGVLKAEFDQMYRDLRSNGIEGEKAADQAMTRLKTVWGASPAAGGQFMRYPPERYYPAVDGSHDWMAKPLEDDIAKAIGQPRLAAQSVPNEIGPRTTENWRIRGLVADPTTEADIAAGRPPSYVVTVDDLQTGRTFIPGADAGAPMRYRWDATGPVEAARAAFGGAREQRDRLRDTLLGGGGEFPEVRIRAGAL